MLISGMMRRVCLGLMALLLMTGHLHALPGAKRQQMACKCRTSDGQRPVTGSGSADASADVMLNVRHQGAVEFVSGGIGDDELHEMKRLARGYPLQLTFAERRRDYDAYTAGVQVTIFDQRGHELLNTVTDGPMLLVRLPAGRYRIEARYTDRVRKASVQLLSGKRRQLVMEWPEAGG